MKTEFEVDRLLFAFKDSIEIDSDGSVYASLTIFPKAKNGVKIGAKLTVEGDVKIEYKGKIYNTPSAFPGELRKIIKSGQLKQDKDVIVHSGNWFEVNIYKDEEWAGFGETVVCNWETPGDVFNLLLNYADNYCRDFINA